MNQKTIAPDEQGRLLLTAVSAEIRGSDITFETSFANIGYWHHQGDSATWKVLLPKSGTFDVYIDASCAAAAAGNGFRIDGVAEPLVGTVAATGGWDRFRQQKVGTTQLHSGVNVVVVRPNGRVKQALFDLREVRLVPSECSQRLQQQSPKKDHYQDTRRRSPPFCWTNLSPWPADRK